MATLFVEATWLKPYPVLLALLLAALCYYLYLAALPHPLPGIPYNKAAATRLFGDLDDVRRAKYRRAWIWNHPRSLGSVVSQAFFAPLRLKGPVVIVTDYREAVDICTRRHKEFDRSNKNKEIVGLVAPNFHFTMKSSDSRFKANRELLRDLMTPTFLQKVSAPRVYQRASSLVELWTLKMHKGQGRPFVASEDLYLSALDTICSVAFGLDDDKTALKQEINHLRMFNPGVSRNADEPVAFPNAPKDPEIEALLDIPEMLAIAQKSFIPAIAQHLALLNPAHARGWWYRRSLIRRQTDSRLKQLGNVCEIDGKQESALDQLLFREHQIAQRLGRTPNFHSAVIRDELLGFLLGGHDTSAAVLSWWVKYMASYQRVQHELRAALRESHPAADREGRWPTMFEIHAASIPYLDAVMEETLRCAAVATIIARTATCDTQILGHAIPEGTDIMLLLAGPSFKEPALPVSESLRTKGCTEAKERVPAWGDDVEIYQPERWLRCESDAAAGANKQIFDPYAGPNMAFSKGPRQCFGKKLAYMQLRTQMTLLIWSFRFDVLEQALNGDELLEKMINTPQDCYVKLSRA
ncbi:putative cytochrome P450 [Paramyrothecium foliicola]|nr:putative cytochrome P450 [Paramyrothecium foliicola]